jgi:MFS family permease
VYGSAVIAGLAATLIWTAQGQLIVMYSSPATRGAAFGIFFALFRVSDVLGNLLLGLLRSTLNQSDSTLFVCFTGISLLGTAVLALLCSSRCSKPALAPGRFIEETIEIGEIVVVQHGTGAGIDGDNDDDDKKVTALTADGSRSNNSVAKTKEKAAAAAAIKEPPQQSVLASVLSMLVNRRFRPLILPITILSGCAKGWLYGLFVLDMGEDRIGFVMSSFGAVLIVGSLVSGLVYDCVQRKMRIFLVTCVMFCAVFLVVLFARSSRFAKADPKSGDQRTFVVLVYVSACGFAAFLSLFEGSMLAFFGHIFSGDDVSAAFSARIVIESLGTVIGVLVIPHWGNLAEVIFFEAAGIVCFVTMALFGIDSKAAPPAAETDASSSQTALGAVQLTTKE